MAKELIINGSLPEIRIALIENGEIQELQIERASDKGIVGNLYKGKVTRVLPGMQAAFVDIGLEKAAFLYVDDVFVHPAQMDFSAPSRPEKEDGGEIHSKKNVSAVFSEVESLPSENTFGNLLRENSSEGSDESQVSGSLLTEEELEDVDSSDLDQDPSLDGDDESDEDDRFMKMDLPSGEDPKNQNLDVVEKSSEDSLSGSQSQHQAYSRKNPYRRGNGRTSGGGRFQHRNRAPHGQQDSGHSQAMNSFKASGIESDRAGLNDPYAQPLSQDLLSENRPSEQVSASPIHFVSEGGEKGEKPVQRLKPHQLKEEFQSSRSRDRRIHSRPSIQEEKPQVNIQDLLKEGQDVIVQVAKDPIAAKGARLTCHISLPGRHLVCMPTINHVGVSRRIERDDERRRLRDIVDHYRPKNLGFIVRTAGGRQQSEKRIHQDIDYLTHLWSEIQEKATSQAAPALLYEDLNAVLRAVRDWVTEEIDKVVVDSRSHYHEMQKFVSYFMPSLKNKIELYHGDIPIFDAYGISTELSRALERKVWLKSGGYIVIDQAEALVAIDVNTGRYVGKKNLEDTILKTNLEAVEEIAYQLRLRNCGGIIILDLIDMEKEENKQRVYRALEDALMRDRARPSILKISELGLIEMTRKRTRDTMVRALCEFCPHCEGKGFIKSKQTVAYEVLREVERESLQKDVHKILVQANADVIDLLAIEERHAVDQLEKKYHKAIYLQTIQNFHPEQFEVSVDKKSKHSRPSSELIEERQPEAGSRETRNEDRHPRPRHSGSSGRFEKRGDRGQRGGGSFPSHGVAPKPSGESTRELNDAPNRALEGSGSSHSFSPRPETASFPQKEPVQGLHQRRHTEDEIQEEEDRLAFLRAQAAQDAALGKMGSGGNIASPHSGAGSGMNTRRGSPSVFQGAEGSGVGGHRPAYPRRKDYPGKDNRQPHRRSRYHRKPGFRPRHPDGGNEGGGNISGGSPSVRPSSSSGHDSES